MFGRSRAGHTVIPNWSHPFHKRAGGQLFPASPHAKRTFSRVANSRLCATRGKRKKEIKEEKKKEGIKKKGRGGGENVCWAHNLIIWEPCRVNLLAAYLLVSFHNPSAND